MSAIYAGYVASNKFKVAGDRTDEFVSGRRVKADQQDDGIEYLTVDSTSYDGSITIVTVKEFTVTQNILRVLYSVVAPGIAGGLPVHTHEAEDQGGGQTAFTLFETDGNGDFMPIEQLKSFFDHDNNGDLMPFEPKKFQGGFDLDENGDITPKAIG